MGINTVGVYFRHQEIQHLVGIDPDRFKNVEGFGGNLPGRLLALVLIYESDNVLDVCRSSTPLNVFENHNLLFVGDVFPEPRDQGRQYVRIIEIDQHGYGAVTDIRSLVQFLEEDALPHIRFQNPQYFMKRKPFIGDKPEASADLKLNGL